LLKGNAVAYFAPTHIMSVELWQQVKSALAPIIGRTSEAQSRIECINGGIFETWTARNETVRGRKYHFVVIDEAAFIPDANLWQAAIRPLLSDYKGHALFASTPRGRNWFWELYNRGNNPDFPDWGAWQYRTSANPYLSADEITTARIELPQRIFQQEYEAIFLEDSGTVFRDVRAICTAQPLSAPQSDKVYVIGVDWGRDNDFTAISVLDDTATQVHLERFNQISYNLQRDRLKAVVNRFKPRTILAEANSIGSVNIDALRADGLPVRAFQTTASSKPQLIDTLALAVEQSRITLLADETLIHELTSYQMTRTPSGHWQYSAPHGTHDDTVIATALSYWQLKRQSRTLIDFA
ncbi:MAG: terminase family protein, partial [Chloroflexota bacterium]